MTHDWELLGVLRTQTGPLIPDSSSSTERWRSHPLCHTIPVEVRKSDFMPRSLLRLRHPHRNRYSLTAPLGSQRNSPRGFPVGARTPPTGLPVLLLSPSCTHAAATTPAEPVGARVARFPTAVSLPRNNGGSASALPVSRPAQRSLTLRSACSLNRPQAILLHRSASVQFVASLHRSDCFRLERQLPGGIRTRWDTAPFHGARRVEERRARS